MQNIGNDIYRSVDSRIRTHIRNQSKYQLIGPILMKVIRHMHRFLTDPIDEMMLTRTTNSLKSTLTNSPL